MVKRPTLDIAHDALRRDAADVVMSPDKLFAYLEGNLPEAERAQLEQQLAMDSQLRRELMIAREIHQRGGESREILGSADATSQSVQRSGVLGRRYAALFGALVLINVFVGISFIAGRKQKNDLGPQEAAIRAQLAASLEKTAGAALPVPTIADEIKISTSISESEAIANKVIALATELGGSGTKALPDEQAVVVWAEVPAVREKSFRDALVPLGASPSASELSSEKVSSPNEKKILQVRISSGEPPKAP